jgi:hypothetical protein
MNWILNNLPAILISLFSLSVSIKGWHKTRVFYGIEVFELQHSDYFGIQNRELQEKLATGKYAILNTYRDEVIVFPEDLIFSELKKLQKKDKVFVLLGKIKQ